jgi:predicted AAA+ superfamily ATPase
MVQILLISSQKNLAKQRSQLLAGRNQFLKIQPKQPKEFHENSEKIIVSNILLKIKR